ncbi:Ankyrin repeat and KH domain-containing protein mask-like Protein [Tribolium castaneum]|uniref:Ankyrin repeat and KH domain-containing protein mask-like Protein n=1 Tax=Tribolium castaneum TaxID=7070 RepID=A0A139WCH7_TRICA|nr:PREDICTED: ankyrin-1-like [Tribolium castaneum]KYB25617.1 Ankyrin repeat and KH domain-containing protein mask-like Protein [Tribolium castaneum]|eukprot:XP_008200709.1 PREDICTED: ankyrin-1-like [Tribolium castaneum]
MYIRGKNHIPTVAEEQQLFAAIRENDLNKVRDIIATGYNLNCQHFSSTPLIVAIKHKNLDMIKLLLDSGANVNNGTRDGFLPLSAAISSNCPIEIIKVLISYGANVNHIGVDFFNYENLLPLVIKLTPLSWAIVKNNKQVAQLLLENGADINGRNDDGTSALRLSQIFNRLEFLQKNPHLAQPHPVVEQTYISKNLEGCTPLTAAIVSGKLDDAKALLEEVDSCKADSNKQTPLLAAVRCENLEAVKLLLNYKANLTIPTAFLEAINLKCLEIVKYLLEKGANVNKKYRDGCTPLIKAIENESLKIVKELLNSGAEVNLANSEGMTPLALAANKRSILIVDLLVETGADINLARQELEEFAKDDEDFDTYYENLKEKREKRDFRYGAHEAAD